MALAVLVVIAIAMRAALWLTWRPGFIGFPDSVTYVIDAHQGLFADPLRVSGYALVLQLLHAIYPHLAFVSLVQHGLGIATGLFAFDTMRRVGLPLGLGLVPAAVLMLDGAEVLVDHAILTEAVFIFLTAVGLWFIVRGWLGRPWWMIGAGLCFGAATIDKTVGLTLLPFALLAVVLAPTMAWRGRALRLLIAALGCFAVIFPFVYAHRQDTGTWGFTSAGYFELYGRVAPWADCTTFKPPKGTARLCIETPVSQRLGNNYWEFTSTSPATEQFGSAEWFGPKPPPYENSELKRFAIAAIEGQPISYLEAVGRDLVRIVDPNFPASPYKAIGNGAYGLTPAGLDAYYVDQSNDVNILTTMAAYYTGVGVTAGNVTFFITWDQITRLEGPALVVILLLALVAPGLSRGLARRLAIVCGLFALVLLVSPILTSEYDFRFTIPAFGFLMTAAAIGGNEVARRAWHLLQRWRMAAA